MQSMPPPQPAPDGSVDINLRLLRIRPDGTLEISTDTSVAQIAAVLWGWARELMKVAPGAPLTIGILEHPKYVTLEANGAATFTTFTPPPAVREFWEKVAGARPDDLRHPVAPAVLP